MSHAIRYNAGTPEREPARERVDSEDRQQFVADLVRRLLLEERAPRGCTVIQFPREPRAASPTRELRALLDQADKKT